MNEHTPSPQQRAREEELIETVVGSFAAAPDARLKEVMQALTRHLHAFVREVRLTEEEWAAGIAFLNAAGRITDERRQEFILLSDVLGVSMQTVAVNNEAYGDATEATVFGPFFTEDAPLIENGGDIAGGAPGRPCWVEGTVTDTTGAPVAGARIEVWEADEDGFYDVQYGDDRVAGRAHLYTDEDGRYRFWGLTPTPYPIPNDGRSESSWMPWAGRPCAPRTCTSWCRLRRCGPSSRTSSSGETNCSTGIRCSA